MAKKTEKLDSDIEATFTPGAKAEKAVARLVKRCDDLKAAKRLAAADRAFLEAVEANVPPLQPHAGEALSAHR